MAEKKVPHRSSKVPSRFEESPPEPDTCVYLDKRQYDTINNCCGALDGLIDAIRQIDAYEAAGLAEALYLVWDKITDILGEVERQEC